jgi:cytochrome c
MNSFEFNKIAGAFLAALLTATIIGYVGNFLVHAKPLPKNVFVVQVAEKAGGTQTAAAAPVAVEPIAPLLKTANADAGKNVFKQCAACHTPDKGGKNGVGPNQWDVIGRKLGSHEGFNYSPAMKAAGEKPGDEGVWTYEHLNAFIANPKAVVPGTRMAYAGLRKPEDRANLIAYLRTLADAPKPLP